MTPIQYAIAMVQRQQANEPPPVASAPKLPVTGPASMTSAAEIADSIEIPRPPKQVKENPDVWAKRKSEALRMAAVERERESVLIAEAENEARRRQLFRLREVERCEREIAAYRNLPADVPEKAFLLLMGANDWEVEKRMLEAEERR